MSSRPRFLLALLLAPVAPTVAADEPWPIALPPGFEISVWGEAPGARALTVLPDGRTVVVGTRDDTVWILRDADGDGRAETRDVLARRLNVPHGVAHHAGWIYVAEQHRVRRARFDPEAIAVAEWELVRGGLPDHRHHGTRDLAMGPDGLLYVALGAPCNVCEPEPPTDSILRMAADGSDEEIFASGIRNSVGMDFHPTTGELFFTDNGSDNLGDDRPPDELNRAPGSGLFFGFPYFGGGRVRTPELAGQDPPREVRFPALDLQPHAAALGIHFYRGNAFPAEYRGDAFIAQHGSWNRSVPIGYRVLRVRFDAAGNPTGREVFAEGWLGPQGPWGRPVDVAELGDGSLLVSDDQAGRLWRIRRGDASRAAAPTP